LALVTPWFRLGYIIPHLHTDLDAYQFYRVAPDGMMLVTTQLGLADYTLDAVEAELETFRARADLLGRQNVDVIALSGVPIASVLGRERMRALLAEVEDRTGRPASTDLEAHIEALHHLGVERLALGSRWPDPVVQALTRYLAAADIEVVAVKTRPRSLEDNKLARPLADHELALELGRAVLREAPTAQGLMLPGGLWYAIHAAPILEAEFGVPVTLNITATTWSAFRRYDGEPPQALDPAWGRLFAS
jgi:maleate cis-trans isomerase